MSAVIKVDMATTTAAQLALLLLEGNRIESDGFHFSAEEGAVPGSDVWVTNPYGIDCALLPLTEEGCDRIKHLVESFVDYGEAGQLQGIDAQSAEAF